MDKILYRGVPIESLSREALIEALVELANQVKCLQHNNSQVLDYFAGAKSDNVRRDKR